MADKKLNVKLLIKNDTAANWATNDVVLRAGEPAYNQTIRELKIGDGTTKFSELRGLIADEAKLAYYAERLELPTEINGTEYNGSNSITTNLWGVSRAIKIGSASKNINGGSNVSYTLSEIGAATAAQGTKADSALQPTGNSSSTTVAFTAATTRANLSTGESLATAHGKLAKWYADLKAVAFSGAYTDLTGRPTIPTTLPSPQALTIQLNGTKQTAYTGSAAVAFNITAASVGALATNGKATSATQADTAVKLTTARTIGVSGVTGTAQSFNGTANITIPITAVPTSLLTGNIDGGTY